MTDQHLSHLRSLVLESQGTVERAMAASVDTSVDPLVNLSLSYARQAIRQAAQLIEECMRDTAKKGI